jgi:hypothetical protein
MMIKRSEEKKMNTKQKEMNRKQIVALKEEIKKFDKIADKLDEMKEIIEKEELPFPVRNNETRLQALSILRQDCIEAMVSLEEAIDELSSEIYEA